MQGLTSQEAERRHLAFGANEIVPRRLETRLLELRKALLDPLGLMLLGLALLYYSLGNRSDSFILLLAYIPVVGVDVLLEIKAQRVLKALQSTLQRNARVIRDGVPRLISIRKIVAGDVLVFDEGQTLAADGTILEAEHLGLNEAVLTGESLPAHKTSGDRFLAGTMVMQGRGLGLVTAIGASTQFGEIAILLHETKSSPTPLQEKLRRIVRKIFVVALILAFLLFWVQHARGIDSVQALIVSMTFGMSAIPEEFPLVYTIYLSLGALHLSRHGVLVKSLPSVEVLGGVNVICADKTGTLTEGNFQLEGFVPLQAISEDQIWRVALMACEPHGADALEAAILKKSENYRPLLRGWHLRWDYPFDPQGKHMSHVWESASGSQLIAMKGSVEGVSRRCLLTPEQKQQLEALHLQNARLGKRILALALREGLCTGTRELDETGLELLGLLIFNDPVRPSVRAAIELCRQEGIDIKMLTGDHPITALAVAQQTGIAGEQALIYTGSQLAQMAPIERKQAYLSGVVFSRVSPEQKHEMVESLRSSGRIVAMTGDGINDAPALKLADIGISMGPNAADVARSAARMILLKNDFAGLLSAISEGRRVFSSLSKSFSYLISFHVPMILLAFAPPLLGFGNILLPIHIVLLQLIVHPISAFAFETRDQLPHPHPGKMLTRKVLVRAILSGLLLSLASIGSYLVLQGQTAALGTLLFGITTLVLIENIPRIHPKACLIAGSLFLLTLLLCRNSELGAVFHLRPIPWGETLASLAFSLGALLPALGMRTREGP